MSKNTISKQILSYGIKSYKKLIYNPGYKFLLKKETDSSLVGLERGVITHNGAVAIDTGNFTGRSPLDKYLVFDLNTKDIIWWSDKYKDLTSNNHPISQDTWEYLKTIVNKQLSNKYLFITDVFCGTNKNSRIKVRFISEIAWQAHFVKNMFIEPTYKELKEFKPDFVAINASKCINPNWKEQGLNSENFIALNLTEKMQIIGGTWYTGEIKKGIFSIMNYLLPTQGIASMHCAANMGKNKDVALFFGLSGTGKTALSADPVRYLIGDDEHGWDNDGVFNLEGGCYAKIMNLSKEKEPEIYKAIRRNALLENVVLYSNGKVNYDDNSKTENTRVSYPIYHIKNIIKPFSSVGHAKHVIFLTADAFGVLPPISILSIKQAQYYFLSGFTSKISGTERGILNHTPTFSACFGAAFLLLHPTIYAKILTKRICDAKSKIFLINTGWNGYGERISIEDTRKIIDAILSDELNNISCYRIPIFNLLIPKKISGINKDILDPRNTHPNSKEWIIKANNLAKLFIENFDKFNNTELGLELKSVGPQI